MKMVRAALNGLSAGCIVLCAATVTAQLAGAGMLWSRGMLDGAKLVRYAGVLYGLDALDLAPPAKAAETPGGDEGREPGGKDELLAARVQESPTVRQRQLAIRKGTDDIRTVVLGLRAKRERQEGARKAFESYLEQLEAENRQAGLREIFLTLEPLPPRQVKDILSVMLADSPRDPQVMADVVTILQMMPADKLSKTFREFKVEEERELLHRILVQIGKLDDRRASRTGGRP